MYISPDPCVVCCRYRQGDTTLQQRRKAQNGLLCDVSIAGADNRGGTMQAWAVNTQRWHAGYPGHAPKLDTGGNVPLRQHMPLQARHPATYRHSRRRSVEVRGQRHAAASTGHALDGEGGPTSSSQRQSPRAGAAHSQARGLLWSRGGQADYLPARRSICLVV